MSTFDYRKYDILFVDDEEKARKYFDREFSKSYTLWLAKDGNEGLRIFKQHSHKIGIIVTDQRMPGLSGVELLEECKKVAPDCVGILSTAYADLEAAVEAINKGNIYHYVSKPWDMMNLRILLRRAMEYYIVQEEFRQLMGQKLARLQDLLIGDRLILLALSCINKYGRMPYSGTALNSYIALCSKHLTGNALTNNLADREDYWKSLYNRLSQNLLAASSKLPDAGMQPTPGDSPEDSTWSDILEGMNNLHLSTPDVIEPHQITVHRGRQFSRSCLDLIFRALRECADSEDLTVYLERSEESEYLFLPYDIDNLAKVAGSLLTSNSPEDVPQVAVDIFHAILALHSAGFTVHYNHNNPKGLIIELMPDYNPGSCGENLVRETLASDSFWLDLISS